MVSPNISMPINQTLPVQRILVLSDRIGATQHISFAQPLEKLLGAEKVKMCMESDQKDWKFKKVTQQIWLDSNPSVLILSRYIHERAMRFLELARKTHTPVIYHIDDDLLDVPISLGTAKYDYYHQPERLKALRTVMNASDMVYVSTPVLADTLAAHGITAPIVAGDIYCAVDPALTHQSIPATQPIIGYMGTGGHSEDLALVLPAIIRLMKEIPALRFETFGTIQPPEELACFGSRYAHHPGVPDYELFLSKLAELGWWVGIAPLEDNTFNRCKADTKWVEYSFAGIPVVASNLPVYHRACADGSGILAGNDADWFNALAMLICNAEYRHKLVDAAQEKLARLYPHSVLEKQLLNVIDQAKHICKQR